MSKNAEVIPEEKLAAFDSYLPPVCGACGRQTVLRAACPEDGHSMEVTEPIFKRLEVVVTAPEEK